MGYDDKTLPLILDGFDDVADHASTTKKRCRVTHYAIGNHPKNTRLYVPSGEDMAALVELGPTVRVVASTATGAVAILPESYGEVGTLRPVVKSSTSASVCLSHVHDALVRVFGGGNVRVRIERTNYGDSPALAVYPVA